MWISLLSQKHGLPSSFSSLYLALLLLWGLAHFYDWSDWQYSKESRLNSILIRFSLSNFMRKLNGIGYSWLSTVHFYLEYHVCDEWCTCVHTLRTQKHLGSSSSYEHYLFLLSDTDGILPIPSYFVWMDGSRQNRHNLNSKHIPNANLPPPPLPLPYSDVNTHSPLTNLFINAAVTAGVQYFSLRAPNNTCMK